MNINNILKKIKLSLGLFNKDLPISDTELVTVIETRSIPDFSRYFPYEKEIPILLANYINQPINKQQKSKIVIELDVEDISSEQELLAVNKVFIDLQALMSAMPLRKMFYDYSIEGMLDEISNRVQLNMYNTVDRDVPSFKFIAPNVVELYNFGRSYNGILYLSVFLNHRNDLSTIPNTVDIFEHLCEADIKSYLYDKFKEYENLNLAVGNLNLYLDKFASGEEERKQIIETLEDTQLCNVQFDNFYVID